MFRISIILLNEFNIFRAHGKSHFPAIAFQLLRRVIAEAFDGGHVFRDSHFHVEGFRLFVFCDLRIYRIDAVVLDLVKLPFF